MNDRANWGNRVAVAGAEGLAIGAQIQARRAEEAHARARGDLQSWKAYAQQLNEALKDTQIDAARQAVIKEECLRELFLLHPAHRLLVKANRQEVAQKLIKGALTEVGLPELAADQERIDRVLAT